MKKVIIAFVAGALFATAGTAAATTVIERVTASVRTDYSVEIDGKKADLKNSPLAYNGSSYLPVKEISELLGKEVGFDNGVIKIETPEVVETSQPEETPVPTDNVSVPSIDELQKAKDDLATKTGKKLLLELELRQVVYLPENEQTAAKNRIEAQIKDYEDELKALEEKINELE